MGANYLMWELSTPMLYVRWVLLKAGHADKRYMAYANAAFALVFFGCRIVFGPSESGRRGVVWGARGRGGQRSAPPARRAPACGLVCWAWGRHRHARA
jgi:hypothetical protein